MRRLFLLFISFIMFITMRIQNFFISVPDKKDLVKASQPLLKDRVIKKIDYSLLKIESYFRDKLEELAFFQVIVEYMKNNPNQIPFKIEMPGDKVLSKWFDRKLLRQGWDHRFLIDDKKRYLIIATPLYLSRKDMEDND